MRTEDEEEIRYIIGRDLDASELETFDRLDAISPVVEAMAGTIAKRQRIVAFEYLWERVPTANHGETLRCLERITEKYPRNGTIKSR